MSVVNDKMVDQMIDAYHGDKTFSPHELDVERKRFRAVAALAHREAEAGAVKPLGWATNDDKYDGGRTHYGTGVFGHWYAVSRIKTGVWATVHHIGGRPEHLPLSTTLEDAKAAAHADYEIRIRSALVAPPAQEPVSFQWCTIDGWVECSISGNAENRRSYAKQMAAQIGLGYRELFAAPPPAVPEGMVLVEYRLLEAGDIIQAGDEVIADDGVTWQSMVGWEVGMRYTNLFKSIRRMLTAAQEGR